MEVLEGRGEIVKECGGGPLGKLEVGGFWGVMGRIYGLGLWRKISVGSGKFLECVRWKLGRGSKIRFWLDEWIEGGSFKD